jgi:hypothetical protein
MSKSEKIKEFNSIMEIFLSQLSPIVGTSYHHYFKRLIKVNSILPIKEYCKNVLPYKQKIMDKDESYFYDTDKHNDLIQNDTNTINEILRLKEIYHQLDKDSINEVWEYFQALLVLSEEYKNLTN